jgi:imidazolonepropionase-like amidohydrolase
MVVLAACRAPDPGAKLALRARPPELKPEPRTFAVLAGTVFPGPDAEPIADAVIVVDRGRILRVGTSSEIIVADSIPVLDARDGFVAAGFWNSHVHFTEPVWTEADSVPAERLDSALSAMLLRYGFVHVFDTGSFPQSTLALRRRIESGELRGPSILTTGPPFVPVNGTPVYVRPVRLPELRDSVAARSAVRTSLATGVDGVKLMSASITEREPYPVLPVSVVRAAVAEAHAAGKPALAHPTNLAGLRSAVEGGVDVLVHTTPQSESWSDSTVDALIAAHVSLVPTLKLWDWEGLRRHRDSATRARFQDAGVKELAAFAKAGGTVLFGTDVGYMSDKDPTAEYAAMARAGLRFEQILASLTTAPARVFTPGAHRGRIAPGFDADLVVLDRDPRADPTAFTSVRWAMRDGRALWIAPGPP